MKAPTFNVGDRVGLTADSAQDAPTPWVRPDMHGVIVRKVRDSRGTFYIVKWDHHHALTIVRRGDLRAIEDRA